MATVIELLGGECTGKSSLAQDLALDLGALVVPEELRIFVDRFGRTPFHSEQSEIMDRQTRALDEAVRQAPADRLIVADPAPAMTAVYSVQYFADESLIDKAIVQLNEADIIVWCQPDLPWSADGRHRDGPEHRARTHQIVADVIEGHFADDRIVRVSGTAQQRLQQVRAMLLD